MGNCKNRVRPSQTRKVTQTRTRPGQMQLPHIYLHILAKQFKSSTLPQLSHASASFCSRLQCQVVGVVIHVISVIYSELAVYTRGILLSLISYVYPCFIQWKFPHTWININSNLLSFLLTLLSLIIVVAELFLSLMCIMH